MNATPNPTLIQSFVRGRFFVSTAYRQSSAMVNSPPWYFETIVWEWDPETKKTGNLLQCKDSGGTDKAALKDHVSICISLAQGLKDDISDHRESFREEKSWLENQTGSREA